MRFTNSPYEDFMKEKSYFKGAPPNLPLDCECYMLGKCWTGAYCRYFRAAVLPLDPVLERSLTVERITETRPCPVCGRAFLPDGRQRYCSPACAGTALREQKRAYMRRKRR